MELLLLLTALFASLTGGSGERGLRQVQGVVVVRAAETAQAAVKPARRAIPVVTAIARRVPCPFEAHAATEAPAHRSHPPFERRLE